MEPVRPALMSPPGAPSVPESVFAEAVGGADRDDEVPAGLLGTAYGQFCRTGVKCPAAPVLGPPHSSHV
ncbi:hypothetical protein ACFY3N_15835 [Streptomyces sp. NPDC000348]|uniref:hypothetical protein n=1 Tax=Streptomyces sp. NPDC000348 TaxID=3364538 RepID=UPI0036AB719E